MEKNASKSKKTLKNNFSFFWKKIKNYFSDWKWWDFAWVAIANISIIVISIIMNDNFVNIVTAITGVLSVIFAAKGKLLTFYFGIINVIIYSTICFFNNLFVNYAIYFFFFLPCNIIGIFTWRKNLSASSSVRTKHFTLHQLLLWVSVLMVVLTSISFLVNIDYNNISKAFLDTSSSLISMVAMLITVLRYREQWLLWVLCNILSITVWAIDFATSGKNIAILVMWIIYLLNSIYGLTYWYFVLKKEQNKNENKINGFKEMGDNRINN